MKKVRFNPWPAERVELLKKLWADGYTSYEVADKLGTTRGAVLGKLHKIGFNRYKIKQQMSTVSTRKNALILTDYLGDAA